MRPTKLSQLVPFLRERPRVRVEMPGRPTEERTFLRAEGAGLYFADVGGRECFLPVNCNVRSESQVELFDWGFTLTKFNVTMKVTYLLSDPEAA